MQLQSEITDNVLKFLNETSISGDNSEFFSELLLMAERAKTHFIELGQNADDVLEENGTKSSAVIFSIVYEWGEEAKAFMLLLRQSIFEIRKAQILFFEKEIDEDKLNKLIDKTAVLINAASEELKVKLNGILEAERNRAFKKKLSKWLLQKSPWPVYSEQIQVLMGQCELLVNEFKEMTKSLFAFRQLRKLIMKDVENSFNILLENKEHFDYMRKELETLSANNNHLQFERSLSHIVRYESKIRQASFHDEFSDKAQLLIKDFPANCNWALEQDFGILYQADVPLQKNLKSWLENEILPLINEIWELTEGSSNGLRMLTYNLSMQLKSALSDKNGQSNLSFDNEKDAIYQLCRDVSTSEKYILELNELAKKRVSEVLYLKTAFSKSHLFSGVSKGSRFNNYFWQSNRLLDVAQIWLKNQWQKVVSIRRSYRKEKKLSTSEKIVRCVLSRKADHDNSHYTSIFLTKGHVGEQFTVGREDDLEHAAQIFLQWKKGFRGAILICGQRFSGKTLFSEMLGHQFFKGNVFRIIPAATLNHEGRTFDSSYDLFSALQFVRKYVDGSKTMILIDDLELWHEETIPLSKNVDQLLKFIDSNASNYFILVTLNNYSKNYLKNFYEIDKYFQAEISMDNISNSETYRAIQIRHKATHKKLQQPGQNHDETYMKGLVSKIYKKANGNIGEALSRWANSTELIDNETVAFRSDAYKHLPKFLNKDSALILSTILLYKRINEKRLRRLFGEAFSEHYVQIIRRLLHVGIIVRQLDGWLEIESSIVNDLALMLEYNGFITYSQMPIISKKK